MRHIVVLFLSLAAMAPVVARSAGVTAPKLESLQTQYSQINRNLKTYNHVQRDLSGYSTEGGALDIYAVNNVPRKIVATYYGETGRASEEYYFWNAALFFVLRSETRYDGVFAPARAKSENRFYFTNGKLVGWIKDGKPIALDGDEARMRQQEVLTSARELLDKAKAALKKE